MGNLGLTRDHFDIEKYTFPYLRDKTRPSDMTDSPFDPLEGFPKGRKPRGLLLLLLLLLFGKMF